MIRSTRMSSRYEVWQDGQCVGNFASAWQAKEFASQQSLVSGQRYTVLAYYPELLAEFGPGDAPPRPTVREALLPADPLTPLPCRQCPVLLAIEPQPRPPV